MSEVIVIGGGGHARVLAGIARRDGLQLAGYADREDRGVRDGLVYLGTDDDIAGRYASSRFLLGVGLMTAAAGRWRLYRHHRDGGAVFVILISSRASVDPSVQLATGTVVMDLAAVNPGASIGEAGIVNTGAVVEHDCHLGDNVHVAPNATLCGEVTVGDHCLIGAGAVVAPGVVIPAGTIVGAGAVVLRSLSEPGTWVGAPAVRRGEGMRS